MRGRIRAAGHVTFKAAFPREWSGQSWVQVLFWVLYVSASVFQRDRQRDRQKFICIEGHISSSHEPCEVRQVLYWRKLSHRGGS